MRSSKEWVRLIIGLGKVAHMMGQVIFGFGLISYWFAEPIFSIYLMLVGIGLVFITSQKVKNIPPISIIRGRRRRERKTKPIRE